MSFHAKTLIFNVPALDPPGTLYTFEGFGFQPKAVFIHWNGRPETVDASGRRNINGGFGAATSISNRGCCSVFEQDAQATMTGGGRIDDSALAQRNAADGTVTAALDLDSFTSDGVKIIVDNDLSTSMDLQITAFGGDELTDAAVMPFRWGPSTGNQDIHGLPFDPGGDSLFIFFGMPAVRADPPALDEDVIELTMGAAKSTSPVQQFVITGKQDDDAGTAMTRTYCRTDECLASIAGPDSDPNCRAAFVGALSDGFTLDVTEHAPVTASSSFVLVIKGGKHKISSFNTLATDTTTIQPVSGVGFTPVGVSFYGYGGFGAQSASDTGDNIWQFTSGGAVSNAIQNCMSLASNNLIHTSDTSSLVNFSSAWAYVSVTVGLLGASFEFISLDSDGFSVRMQTSSTSLFIPYIAYGQETTPPVPDTDTGATQYERETPQATWNRWGPWRAKVRRILEEEESARQRTLSEREKYEIEEFILAQQEEDELRIREAIAALLIIDEL